eukprot:TRINITY_DN12336_c0_g1_i1.p1 TRINITY_DN12336_c0_g1~~TRINITY_DN12336_c0_g1_i1.p1  ORF type:complete len:110 (-),score=28.33 TRINITY_DN12336_c0_g1_i1:61-390(-)
MDEYRNYADDLQKKMGTNITTDAKFDQFQKTFDTQFPNLKKFHKEQPDQLDREAYMNMQTTLLIMTPRNDAQLYKKFEDDLEKLQEAHKEIEAMEKIDQSNVPHDKKKT